MSLTGQSFIGFSRGASTESHSPAYNPATGETISPGAFATTKEELKRALELAENAYQTYRDISGKDRAAFLRAIADNLAASEERFVAAIPLETGLPEPRVRGELGRTMGQLRLFAGIIEEGSWVEARIETAQPDRAPIPKVDLRSMLRPLGPVAVFSASNFPLAFAVAGGDTASALASGCPVIVKAHSSHPAASEIAAEAVIKAAQETNMPEGVFSVVFDTGFEIGQALVKADAIKAVGFTGSQAGGRALMDIAAARKEPIPVYAEMSAINPVVMLPSVLGEKSEATAEAFFGSLTLGVGQFCTNPGLVFIPAGSNAFTSKLKDLTTAGQAATMLNAGICQAYKNGTAALASNPSVETVAQFSTDNFGQVGPAIFQTTATDFLSNDDFSSEVFGPATLLVTYENTEQLNELCSSIEGQLTASIFGTEQEITTEKSLITTLEQKAGRVIINGYPTGVEVCNSMVHGGPYPSTSDGRSTSVGSMAIFRFTRPVSYQSFPESLLPAELQTANPLGVKQLINQFT